MDEKKNAAIKEGLTDEELRGVNGGLGDNGGLISNLLINPFINKDSEPCPNCKENKWEITTSIEAGGIEVKKYTCKNCRFTYTKSNFI